MPFCLRRRLCRSGLCQLSKTLREGSSIQQFFYKSHLHPPHHIPLPSHQLHHQRFILVQAFLRYYSYRHWPQKTSIIPYFSFPPSYGHGLIQVNFFSRELCTDIDVFAYVCFVICSVLFWVFIFYLYSMARTQRHAVRDIPLHARDPRTIAHCSWAMTLLSSVFHRDIQTPRRELKIQRCAEYLWRYSRFCCKFGSFLNFFALRYTRNRVITNPQKLLLMQRTVHVKHQSWNSFS